MGSVLSTFVGKIRNYVARKFRSNGHSVLIPEPESSTPSENVSVRKCQSGSIKGDHAPIDINDNLSYSYTSEQNKDGVTPLDLLPPEIWEEVLKQLSDSKDLLNCYHATKVWEILINRSKWTTIFHEVYHPSFTWNMSLYYETLENAEDFYGCRFVCRSWKKTVNTFIENISEEQSSFHIKGLVKMWITTTKKLDDYSSINEDSFLMGMVGFRNDDMDDDYWPKVLEFMSRFGKSIRCCELIMEELPETETMLREALTHLVNLRQLGIEPRHGVIIGNHMEMHELDSDDAYDQMNLFFEEYPLPNLTYLEKVTFYNIPAVYHRVILNRYGSQLKTVRIYNNYTQSNERWNLPRVEKLSLIVHSVEELDKKGWINSRLKSLHLIVFQSPVDFQCLISALNKFESTLTDLHICFWIVSAGSSKLSNLQLPLLEKVCLKNYHGPVDFLLNFQSLHTIEIGTKIWSNFHECRSRQSIIQFYGLEDKMYKSNIWTLIPKLEEITVTNSDYHRADLRKRHYTRTMLNYLKKKQDDA